MSSSNLASYRSVDNTYYNDNRASSIYPPTISPPDSPHPSDVNSSNPDISPISTHGPTPVWLRPSNIPVPTKRQSPADTPRVSTPDVKPAPAPPAPSTGSGWRDMMRSMTRTPSPAAREAAKIEDKNTEPTRWDTYSGEKTDDVVKGKAGAVSPTQHPYKGTDPGFGYTAHITGGTTNGKPSHFLHVKLRKASDRKELPPQQQQQQEPWRGASGVVGPSGRTATVDPVADKPVEKRHFPTPAERRAKGFFQRPGASGRASPGPNSALRSNPPTGGRMTPQPDEKPGPLRVMTGALDSMRGAASKAMPQRPTTSQAPDGEVVVSEPTVFKYRLGGSRSESPATPSADYGYDYSPFAQGARSVTMPVGSNQYVDSPASYGGNAYVVPPRKDSRAFNPVTGMATSRSADDYDPGSITQAFHSMGFINEPKSHFSATTYDPSERSASAPGTPRTAAPGEEFVPPLPNEGELAVPVAKNRPISSILNRKRPVPSAANQFKVKPTRKPTPGQQNGNISGSGDEAAPVESPKPKDRVTLLEEKLAGLNRRKISLAAVIGELTSVTQPTSLAYDMASRTEIRKTVEGLKIEQDAVLKEIQEIGIKLIRAYKKKDEEGGGGGTGLWVRRVTVE